MAHSSDSRVLSQPCDVYWTGFRSTTSTLQQNGWEIAVEQDFREGRLRLLMRHRDLRLYAISDHSEFNFMRAAQEYTRPPVFHVVQAGSRIEIITFEGGFGDFMRVDATPQFVTRERKSIEDFGIFAVPLVRTEEIIVAPADVSELMEQIRRMQSPEQKAIRDREASRSREGQIAGAAPVHKFHAQILSFERGAA